MTLDKTTTRNAVRVFNKHVLNPAMLHIAGRKHFYASVIHHTGRNSGRRYSTPVVADRVVDGFLVPLPYGTGVDWLKNVQAQQHCTIEHHGQTVAVGDPVVVDAAVALAQLPPRRRQQLKHFGIAHFLHLSMAGEAS